jgi:hypothetical protein
MIKMMASNIVSTSIKTKTSLKLLFKINKKILRLMGQRRFLHNQKQVLKIMGEV